MGGIWCLRVTFASSDFTKSGGILFSVGKPAGNSIHGYFWAQVLLMLPRGGQAIFQMITFAYIICCCILHLIRTHLCAVLLRIWRALARIAPKGPLKRAYKIIVIYPKGGWSFISWLFRVFI